LAEGYEIMHSMSAKSSSACSSPVLDYLEQLHRDNAAVADGKLASYIPELAKANPNWFGICLVTTNGVVYEAVCYTHLTLPTT
jgi:glutaminase